MTTHDLFTPAAAPVNPDTDNLIDLRALFPELLPRLPVALRMLLENVMRNLHGQEQTHAVEAMFDWLESCTSVAEIAIHLDSLGMVDWSAGGLAFPIAGSGTPALLRLPDVIGVRLTGRWNSLHRPHDLAKAVAERLRRIDVAGRIVEFYGPGLGSLTVGHRTAIASMAPDYQAASVLFPVDDQTLAHLRQTGHSDERVHLTQTCAKRAGLWLDPDEAPHYTLAIRIDLSDIRMPAAEVA